MMTKDHEYLYPYSAQEAKKRNQLPMWRKSYHANVACRKAIEETVRQNFDGMHLKKDCLEPVLAEYGYKRTEWVLATTLQELSWDGRFSRANKQWAARRYIPQDERHNAEITVRSHPAILDGFVDLYREAYQKLALFGPEHCVGDRAEQDYIRVFLLQCFYRLDQRADELRDFRGSICDFPVCCGHEFSSQNGFNLPLLYHKCR